LITNFENITKYIVNDKTYNYYKNEFNNAGKRSLFNKILIRQNAITEHTNNIASEEEINCHLGITSFCMSLNRSQQKQFGGILGDIYRSYLINDNRSIARMPN
jgi:hypothetical protein